MSQYYYTVSALPLLFYESDIPDDALEEFVDFCSYWVSTEDFHLLTQADYSSGLEGGLIYPLLFRWQEWERALRNALVELRAPGRGEEAFRYIKENEKVLGLEEIAREAYTQESPLDGEEILNRARWSFLDELETGHYFDIDVLIVHHLKLQILSRKSLFKKEAGQSVYERVFEELTDYDVHKAMKQA